MISYLGSLVQFSPAAGRAGLCRQTSLCVGSTRRVPATLGLPRTGVSAFPVCTAQAPGCSIWCRPCLECGSSFRVLLRNADSVAPAFWAFPSLSGWDRQRLGHNLPWCGVPFPSTASGPGSQGLGRTLPGCGAPFPSATPARASGRVSGSLQTGTGACLPGGRGWLLRGWVCPFPLPLPPTSSGDGPALLWSFSVPFANGV